MNEGRYGQDESATESMQFHAMRTIREEVRKREEASGLDPEELGELRISPKSGLMMPEIVLAGHGNKSTAEAKHFEESLLADISKTLLSEVDPEKRLSLEAKANDIRRRIPYFENGEDRLFHFLVSDQETATQDPVTAAREAEVTSMIRSGFAELDRVRARYGHMGDTATAPISLATAPDSNMSMWKTANKDDTATVPITLSMAPGSSGSGLGTSQVPAMSSLAAR